MRGSVLGAIALLVSTLAHAAVVIDQEQSTVTLGTSGDGFLVDDVHQYQLAQTVTAGVDGRLVAVELAVVCESGALIVEIRDVAEGDVPGATVHANAAADASRFPPSGGYVFQRIDLEHGVRMSAGERFAIVLRNESGRCFSAMGLSVDLYPGGRSVFRDQFTPPGVWLSTGGFLDPIDASFRTLVDTGAGGGGGTPPCVVQGFPPLPFGGFVPVCRCLQDASLRESRCGFFHPEFFLYRTLPYPISPGKAFPIRWTLVPLAPLDGLIEIRDVLPKGFQDPKGPLTFFAGQVSVGSSLTLETSGVAGPKGGAFQAKTEIRIAPQGAEPEEGSIRSTIVITP